MATRNKEYDHFLKFVIVGDSAVGKSSLLLRFGDDQFDENYMSTIGVDFRFKTVQSGSKNVKLQIWDTAGQEKFRTIASTYYKNANAVIIVYDMTNDSTFQSITDFWLKEIANHADPTTKLVLVGNKSDKRANQQVATEHASQLARQRGLLFFQTSAKTAEHVNESFMGITHQVIRNVGNKNKPEVGKRVVLANSVQLENRREEKACCY